MVLDIYTVQLFSERIYANFSTHNLKLFNREVAYNYVETLTHFHTIWILLFLKSLNKYWIHSHINVEWYFQIYCFLLLTNQMNFFGKIMIQKIQKWYMWVITACAILFLLNYKTQESRQITHLQYTSWPDHGTPNPLELLSFYHYVSKAMEQHPEQKLVVHCRFMFYTLNGFLCSTYNFNIVSMFKTNNFILITSYFNQVASRFLLIYSFIYMFYIVFTTSYFKALV